jgi:hypothetical protein
MDCKHAQRLFDDFAGGRLCESDVAELRRHLADCTDCRVLQQRGARLRRLLALKRYERPSPEYWGEFLAAFHRRLAQTAPEASRWPAWQASPWLEHWLARSPELFRYGLAGAAALSLAISAAWWGLPRLTQSPERTAGLTAPEIRAALPPATLRGPVTVILPADAGLTNATRYVLDKISVAPASYEVASIRF